jgi:hypothetical protein
LVFGLGEETRIRTVRHLSNFSRGGCFDLGIEIIRVNGSGNIKEKQIVADKLFGILSAGLKFLQAGAAAPTGPSRHSAFPKMLRRIPCVF